MSKIAAATGQIWRDDCYYFDGVTGECKRKFVLVLAVDSSSGDLLTAVFTSKPHGLVQEPACSLALPVPGITLAFRGMLCLWIAGLSSAALIRWTLKIWRFTCAVVVRGC